MDYRRIALEKWDIFGPLLGYGLSGNKERKTSWMVTVNDKRNIVSHPSSGVALSLEELAQLEEIDAWLSRQIEMASGSGGIVNGSSELEMDEDAEGVVEA